MYYTLQGFNEFNKLVYKSRVYRIFGKVRELKRVMEKSDMPFTYSVIDRDGNKIL